MMKHNGWKKLAAAAVLAASLSLAMPAAGVLAATGTVIGTQVNVRGDASTSAAIVGTVNSGDTFDLGESKEDDTGATWYQITLDDGTAGYVRSDFLNISEDDNSSEASSASSEGTTEASTAASTDTSSTPTGDWQIIYSQDDQGDYYYYLYDNANNERMKLSDVATLRTQVQEAQAEVTSIRNQYRMILLILAILLGIMIAVCILLVVRLRDAVNGRRNNERDLAQERRNQRRSGEPNPDGLNSLKRGGAKAGYDARRNDAYASGSRRVSDTNPAAARDPRAAARRQENGRPLTSNVNTAARGTGTNMAAREGAVRQDPRMAGRPAPNAAVQGQNGQPVQGMNRQAAAQSQAAMNRQAAMAQGQGMNGQQSQAAGTAASQAAARAAARPVSGGQEVRRQVATPQGAAGQAAYAAQNGQRMSGAGNGAEAMRGQAANRQQTVAYPQGEQTVRRTAQEGQRPGQQNANARAMSAQGDARSQGDVQRQSADRRPQTQRPVRSSQPDAYSDDDDDLELNFVSMDEK